jgi:hypothetical protein
VTHKAGLAERLPGLVAPVPRHRGEAIDFKFGDPES